VPKCMATSHLVVRTAPGRMRMDSVTDKIPDAFAAPREVPYSLADFAAPPGDTETVPRDEAQRSLRTRAIDATTDLAKTRLLLFFKARPCKPQLFAH